MLPHLRRHFLALLLLTLALPGCGIVLSAEFEGTEVFRDIEVASDVDTGSPIEVAVTVRQPYPIPLAIACAYEDVELTDDERLVAFSERAGIVYETVLEPNATPPPEDADPPEQVLHFEVTVEEPGTYFVACFTVASPENGIGRRFTTD